MSRLPWSSLGIGFGAVIGVPVLAVLLFITLLGIPLGIVLLALFPGLLLLGYVVGLSFLAWRLRVALHQPEGQGFGRTMGLMAATLLLVMLIGRLPSSAACCTSCWWSPAWALVCSSGAKGGMHRLPRPAPPCSHRARRHRPRWANCRLERQAAPVSTMPGALSRPAQTGR